MLCDAKNAPIKFVTLPLQHIAGTGTARLDIAPCPATCHVHCTAFVPQWDVLSVQPWLDEARRGHEV